MFNGKQNKVNKLKFKRDDKRVSSARKINLIIINYFIVSFNLSKFSYSRQKETFFYFLFIFLIWPRELKLHLAKKET